MRNIKYTTIEKPTSKINGELLQRNDVFVKNGEYSVIVYPDNYGKNVGKNRKCTFLSDFKNYNYI